MPKTYDPSRMNEIDWVRLLTGDRNIAVSPVTDEEIQAVLEAESGNRYLAAYRIGMLIHSSSNGIVSEQVDDLRITYSGNNKGASYLAYLQQLRTNGSAGKVVFKVL
jgi:hypothetical protein